MSRLLTGLGSSTYVRCIHKIKLIVIERKTKRNRRENMEYAIDECQFTAANSAMAGVPRDAPNACRLKAAYHT
jgi:hypothetical protein